MPLPSKCPHCALTLKPQEIVWKYGAAYCPRCKTAMLPPPEKD